MRSINALKGSKEKFKKLKATDQRKKKTSEEYKLVLQTNPEAAIY